ncbi:DUF802 domain-containing protein [Paraburkholderia adhaesiva]|uniref:DUF802 domain-containing protein n=1 Tax=Paraburkholderia adhaesiva TaxID=2883244 RepID=UPI001F1C7D29|nr:DUF802 domain-containing protein [Paraburkholderia adhaesiva]
MSRFRFDLVVFLAGLAAVCWIAFGYLGSNPLALAVTLLIGACYVAGALELRRYSQATATLQQAVASLSEPPATLDAWLDRLHPGLRGAVRLRVMGERVALPGPALTPYLVGLLVLLGMLGTLLGMVATLKGTGAALQSATDPLAIRASLAAPVKGLGFAFGTSIAGVATSAMLGLMSALARRQRSEAAEPLDTKIATTLRVFSHAHQRDASFKLMQRQAEAMPVLVDRLQAMMQAIEQQSLALNERQIAMQQQFLGKTEATYAELAGFVARSLKESAADGARAASAAIQPVVETTMASLKAETAALHSVVTQAVERQLAGLSGGLETTTAAVSTLWHDALADHRRSNDALAADLRTSLDRYAETFEQRSAGLLDGVAARLDNAAGTVSEKWSEALALQSSTSEKLAANHEQALSAVAATFEQRAAALLHTVDESHTKLQSSLASGDEARLAAWRESVASMSATLREHWDGAAAQTVDRQQAICDTLERTASTVTAQTQAQARDTIESVASMSATLREHWDGAAAQTADRQQAICDTLERTASAITAQTQAQARDTIESVASMSATLREHWDGAAAQTAERQQAICDTLERTASAITAQTQAQARDTIESVASMSATLREHLDGAAAQTADRQQAICDTLERTANAITAQTQAQARDTIDEIGRLVQAASEAPRAAAEVVAELRQKLSDSMARDNAMLEERSRLLTTLETLLDAVNHASTQQRGAIDALVGTSADLLERVGKRFTDRVESEVSQLDGIAAQVTSGAIEVASLGDAFGAAVQAFGESNDKLVAHLERIEGALDKSLTRSDEQLAYYVAQAREVIDLSMLSQRQIMEDLQQLADRRADVRAAAGADAE